MKKSFEYDLTKYDPNAPTRTEQFLTADGAKTLTTDANNGAVLIQDSVDPDSLNPVTAAAVATAVAGASGEVPVIGDGDNGKVLKAVVDGSSKSVEWGDDNDTTYTFSTGLTESSGTVTVANPVPTPGASDSGKVLTVTDANGNYDWAAAGGGDIVFVTLDTGMSSAEAETLFNTISAAVSGGKRVIGVRESSTPPVTTYYQYPLMWLSDNMNVYDRKAIFTAVYYNTGSSTFRMESYAVGNLHVYNEYVVEFASSDGGTGQH